MNKTQKERLKALEAQQQRLRGNAELESTYARHEAEAFKAKQMRVLTDKVTPVEAAYKKGLKSAEAEKKRVTKEAQRKFIDTQTILRETKQEALNVVEREVRDLRNTVQARIDAALLKIRKELFKKLHSIDAEKAALEKVKK